MSGGMNQGQIRVGVGGWLYAPWRGVFYPKGLKQADELAYAASKLTSIEINATHYRLQSPSSFRKWAAATPKGFKFSLKAPRIVTNSKALAETGGFVDRFVRSGLLELGDKLGPILWQLPPFKRFDTDEIAKFLSVLPRDLDGVPFRHVLEVRHGSFATPDFVRLLRDEGVAVAYTDARDWPNIPDITGDVVYARLQQGDDALETAYPGSDLDAWAGRAKILAGGDIPPDLQPLTSAKADPRPREVFMYFIHEGKLRAPAAAMAIIDRVKG